MREIRLLVDHLIDPAGSTSVAPTRTITVAWSRGTSINRRSIPPLYIITYFGERSCCLDGVVDDDDESLPAPFVINFGSTTTDRQRSGSPWPYSDDDTIDIAGVQFSGGGGAAI